LLADTNGQTVLEPVSDMEVLAMGSEDISQSDLAAADAGTTTQTRPAMGMASSGIVVRRVWENAQDFMGTAAMGSVSPDGRYISYINWDKGNLAIHDFETGENRDVTDEGHWGKNRQFADVSIWSPDSKQLAYRWCGPKGSSLRIVGIDGSRPRVLRGGPCPSLRAWSRDGKHILARQCRRTDKTHEHDIVLVSVEDGSIRVLKSPDGHTLESPNSLSPDGRYVVYDSPENSLERDIFLMATDGSHETTLVEHPANDFEPFWAPDGNRIVFTSDRSGSLGIWILEVVDGKPKGSPQLIKENLNGMIPWGLTQDGSYYYRLMPGAGDVYIAALDPETGEVAMPPAKAVQSFEGFNHHPAFSPDGKYLAYLSKRPKGSDYSRVLVIRSLETGEERVFSPENIMIAYHTCWSPDGRSILISTIASSTLGPDIYQIDIETGAATPVVLSDEQGSILPRQFVLSPDGNRIFFIRGVDGVEVIRIYDLEAEREWQPDFQLAGGEGYARDLDLSPDGQQLALGVSCDNESGGIGSVQIAPSAGGETREALRLRKEEARWGCGQTWTPDGRYLLFTRRKDEATELWRIPVEGGAPESLGLTMKTINHLSFHPDGRRIVFTGPDSGHGGEIWAIENFLPGFAADK